MGASLRPDQSGDLAAFAALTPAANPVAGGISVFGLPASQNSVTLNGLAFPGSAMPREARTSLRFVTNTYDPSRGWFGGANTRVELTHDFVYSALTSASSLEAVRIGGREGALVRPSAGLTSLRQSIGTTGWWSGGRLTYNVSAQASRRATELTTLEDASVTTLARSGIIPDSATRLRALSASRGLLLDGGGASSAQSLSNASLLLGIGTAARDVLTYQPARTAVSLTFFLGRYDADGLGMTVAAAPSVGSRSATSMSSVQGAWSSFLKPTLLQDFRTAISLTERRSGPTWAMPAASVLVANSSTSSSEGAAILALGGSGAATRRDRTFTWESQSETRFYLTEAHRVHINADVRYDAISRSSAGPDLGAFYFNSVGDFAENRPSIFRRTLAVQYPQAGVWNGFLSAADFWRPVHGLELVYGTRLEGNVFAARPSRNPSIESAFGERTDFVPNTVHVSPRLGFSWQYNSHGSRGGWIPSEHGDFRPPRVGVIRGGIGEFRSMLVPDVMSGALTGNGLPGGLQQVTCVGQAVPAPDWAAYARSSKTIPEDCVGSASTSFQRDGATPIRLVAPDFTAARSWRGNVAWTSYHDAFVWTVEGVYALNLNQPSQADLNFKDEPAFQLGGESGRPVYVPASAIDAASGAVLSTGSRRVPNYGTVFQARSDQRSSTSQLSVTLIPDLTRYARSPVYASLSYSLSHQRLRHRGFDGATFESPTQSSWTSSSLAPTHSFVVQTSVKTKFALISVFGRFSSGMRFTPMVGSDINGDGLANDRAFLFNPSGTTDTVVANGLRSLLAGGSRDVRSCLNHQLGQVGAENSCRGPWTATMNAMIRLNTGSSTGWMRRLNASLYFENPLGGLDQLLHGSKRRGWGAVSMSDPTLLRVRGFDLMTSRYRYAVNPTFGSTDASRRLNATPFQMTLDIRLDFSTPPEQQILDRSLQSGRGGHPGKKRSAAATKRFYAVMASSVDPFTSVLTLTDSLLLTSDQVRAALAGQSRFNARVDSVLTEFSDWLAGLPDQYDAAAALRRQEEFFTTVLNIGREEFQTSLQPTLNRMQLRLLPWPADAMVRAKNRMSIRDLRQ